MSGIVFVDEEDEVLAPATAAPPPVPAGHCAECEKERAELARRRAILQKNENFADVVKAREELARIKKDVDFLRNSPVMFRVEDGARMVKDGEGPGRDTWVYPSTSEPSAERYKRLSTVDTSRTCAGCGCRAVGDDGVCGKCGQKKATV